MNFKLADIVSETYVNLNVNISEIDAAILLFTFIQII